MFHAVLEIETISKNVSEERFLYKLTCFYSMKVFVSESWNNGPSGKGVFFRGIEFSADLKN
jgi:hypothetical protein